MPPKRNRSKRSRPAPSTARDGTEKATTNEPSRLKRSRRPDEENIGLKQSTMLEQSKTDLQGLKNLTAVVTMCVEHPSDLQPEFLLSIVKNITNLVRTIPVTVILEHAPKLPAFLSSVRKSPLAIDVSIIVACFLQIVLQIISETLSGDNLHSKATLATQHETLIKRALEWALQILTDLIKRPSSHSVHEQVFVEPPHKLHDVMLMRQNANLANVIRSIAQTDCKSLPAIIRRICNILTSVMPKPSCHVFISTVITEIGKLPLMSSSTEVQAQLPEDFVNSVFTSQWDKWPVMSNKLSLEAQAELLFISEKGYEQYVANLREKMTWTTDIEIMQKETQSLAEAAVNYVEIHWRLMNNVRQEINAKSHSKNGSVFGIHLWKDRVWMRGVLSATEEKLGEELIWRIYPGIRQCLRQLFILDEAFRRYGNVHAGVIGARKLYEGMKLNQRRVVSRNCQATLIIIESIVERLIWACGRSQRPKQGYVSNTEDTAKMCAAIICALQTVRWRGSPPENALDESEQVKTLLFEIWCGNFPKVSKRQQNRMKITSSLAIAVIAAQGAEVAKDFFARVSDNEEAEHEIRWALSVSKGLEDRHSHRTT